MDPIRDVVNHHFCHVTRLVVLGWRRFPNAGDKQMIHLRVSAEHDILPAAKGGLP